MPRPAKQTREVLRELNAPLPANFVEVSRWPRPLFSQVRTGAPPGRFGFLSQFALVLRRFKLCVALPSRVAQSSLVWKARIRR